MSLWYVTGGRMSEWGDLAEWLPVSSWEVFTLMTEPRQTDKAQTPGDDSPDDGPKTDPVPTELESGDEGDRKETDQ